MIRYGALCLLVLCLTTFTSCKKTTNSFALVSPASNTTNVTNSQTFSCTNNGALTYTFVFNGSIHGYQSTTASVNNTTVTFLYPNETYTWNVIANMPDGSTQTSPTWSFTTSGNAGGAITLQQPAYNATGVCTTPTFSWTGSSTASYLLVIATDASFANSIYNTNVTGTSFTIPSGILGSHNGYYWRVAPAGTTDYSDTYGFTTVNPPSMLSPMDNSTTSSTNVSFSWAPVLCATAYTIQLSKYSDFHNVATEQTFSTTSCTLTQLSSASTYYWRVKVAGDPYYSYTLYGVFMTP